MSPPPHASPEAFLAHVFGAQAVRDGKVIRRAIRDIDRYVGRQRFLNELSRRGFAAVENAGQMVIFCNAEPIRLVPGTVFIDENGSERPAFRARNCRQFR